MGGFVRKANKNDLSRIAEIQVFNYRLFFYPIFKSDDYYFNELSVPSLMQEYESGLDSLYVYDDGAVKGFIKIEGTYIAKLFVEPVLQNLRKKRVCFNRREKAGRRNIRVSSAFKEKGIARKPGMQSACRVKKDPVKRTEEDDRRFAESFERLITETEPIK